VAELRQTGQTGHLNGECIGLVFDTTYCNSKTGFHMRVHRSIFAAIVLLVLMLAIPLAVMLVAAIIAVRNGVPEGGIEAINKPPRHLKITWKTLVDEWINKGDKPAKDVE